MAPFEHFLTATTTKEKCRGEKWAELLHLLCQHEGSLAGTGWGLEKQQGGMGLGIGWGWVWGGLGRVSSICASMEGKDSPKGFSFGKGSIITWL